jgi:hypothetical protein
LLRFANATAKDGTHYFVLLIITDGVISDLERTKEAIVYVSFFGFSFMTLASFPGIIIAHVDYHCWCWQ